MGDSRWEVREHWEPEALERSWLAVVGVQGLRGDGRRTTRLNHPVVFLSLDFLVSEVSTSEADERGTSFRRAV